MADKTVVVQEIWPQVLEAVKERRLTWMLLSQHANVLFYDGATLTLAWISQDSADTFVRSGSVGVLEEVLEEVLSRPVAVELVLEKTPPVPPYSMSASPAAPMHAPAAAAPPLRPAVSAASTLHRVLGQTAFLMHEQGNSQAAALLTDVGTVELAPGNRSGERTDAVLIVPPYLVPRFTGEVLAAIQPVFVHVAGRHGLQVSGVSAAPALPEIGDDWRQNLQAKLAKGAAASEQASTTYTKEASSPLGREDLVKDQTSGCTRSGKTTGRRCRRPAAEWPAYDDLPPPVAACAGHLTPEEWEACQQARNRRGKENSARWKAELAAPDTHDHVPEPAAKPTRARQPCIGQCTSQERAWGRDSDSASMMCANCDGWVCVSCGQAQVEGILEFCVDCSESEETYAPEPEWDRQYNGEADTGPNPHARLTAMVNALVKATGTTHREVNARLNRKVGVTSRVGADEQIIRRAVGAARAWLDQLGSST